MSECVVRMEMPESCYECRRRYLFNKCSAYNGSVIRRSENCPIICQLPEGHGRLVDADSMEKDLNYDVELDAKALADMNIVGYARERFQFDKDRKQDCIRYLSGQKTIVPAEAERSEKK